jgi:carbonic anhydrase
VIIPSDTSRRRFLATALTTTLGAGLGAATLSACGSDDQPTDQAAASGTRPPGTSASQTNASATGGGQPAGGQGPQVEPPVADGNDALKRLMDGNQRFVANQAVHVDEGTERRVAVSKAQHPFATVLGCVDSRVPVELVFDRGLGDLVVVRSAGEVLDHSVTGSLEFGVAELGTPLLMVLGHQRCGAIDATMKALKAKHTEEEGQIGYLLDALAPAVRQVAGKSGDPLANAVHANVDLVLAQLRKSPVLGPLEKAGKVKLVGAYYELDTGRVIVS